MKNNALEDIKKFAMERLKREYGYCGVAEGENDAMLNSGGDDENITVKLKYENDYA